MTVLLWPLFGFWMGAIPFSVWLGRLALQTDIRLYGDGNPGATNAWQAGGWRIGLPALLLDYLKGAVPVGLAHFHAGLTGWSLAIVALAPILGHAFTPFLGFRGGKALAVTFGVWTGLTLGEYPILFGLCLAIFLLTQTGDGWAVFFSIIAVLAYQIWFAENSILLTIWSVNGALLTWKYRADLTTLPQFRPFLRRYMRWFGGRISHFYLNRRSLL